MIIGITERKEDLVFLAEVAKVHQTPITIIRNAEELRNSLGSSSKAFVFWDVDHTDSQNPDYPTSYQSIATVIKTYIYPGRIFLMSTKPLIETPYVFQGPVFWHHFYRQYKPPAAFLASKILNQVEAVDPFGLEKYAPSGSKIQKITLNRSAEKAVAMTALGRVLNTLKIPNRLNEKVVQAVDEMIMNALFDAPVKNGAQYRIESERTLNFSLTDREVIDIFFGISPECLSICVRDYFGTFHKEIAVRLLRNNYHDNQYQVKESTRAAGLGIYGIVLSGLSMLVVNRPGKMTEVMIFVPVVKNMKSFRDEVRFLSLV